MPRLTITLPPEKHRALKEASVRQGKTIRSLVEESLDAYGNKIIIAVPHQNSCFAASFENKTLQCQE